MKKIVSVILILLLINQIYGQNIDSSLYIKPNKYLLPIAKKAIRGSYPLELSFYKTTHIIFPSKIRDFDAGSESVIATVPPSITNVLRVKAGKKDFNEETNMTILTEDGGYFSFVIHYNENPDVYNINIANNLRIDELSTDSLGIGRGALSTNNIYEINQGEYSEEELRRFAGKALKQGKYIRHVGAKKADMSVFLKGIYFEQKVFYLLTTLENSSSIPYEIDFVKVFIRDKNVLKRTAFQEDELKVLINHPEGFKTVNPNSVLKKVIGIPFITLTDGKIMEVEIYEKDGGRHLKFQLDNETITQSKSI